VNLLEQMRTYLRITETRSLSEAARGLRLSVAAVSRQLAALEADLGVTLVTRSTRRLLITESGERWREHCARVLAAVDAAHADVKAGPEVRGRVVISAPASYALVHLAGLLDRLLVTHPALSIELRLEDHTVDLVGEGVDIAVRAGMAPPDSGAFIAHRLGAFRRVLVASPSYLRKRGTPKLPRELSGHELLAQTRATAAFTRWTFTRDHEEVEVTVNGRRMASSPLLLREWAKNGVGIALIPSWLAEDLRVLLPEWLTPPIAVHAIHRVEARGVPRIAAVVGAVTGLRALTEDEPPSASP
jgi:DNA-binding transcriptional LysR family regulator